MFRGSTDTSTGDSQEEINFSRNDGAFQQQLQRAEIVRTRTARQLIPEDSASTSKPELAPLKKRIKAQREQELVARHPQLSATPSKTSAIDRQDTEITAHNDYSHLLTTLGSLVDLNYLSTALPGVIEKVKQQLAEHDERVSDNVSKNAKDFIVKADLVHGIHKHRINFLNGLHEIAAESRLDSFLRLAELMLNLESLKEPKRNKADYRDKLDQLKTTIIHHCQVNQIDLDQEKIASNDMSDFKEAIKEAVQTGKLSAHLLKASQVIEEVALPASIAISVDFQIWNDHTSQNQTDPLRNSENFISPVIEWKTAADRLSYLADLGDNEKLRGKLTEQSNAITRTGFDIIEDSISDDETNFLSAIERELKGLEIVEDALDKAASHADAACNQSYDVLKDSYDDLEKFLRLRDWYAKLTSGFGINILQHACDQAPNTTATRSKAPQPRSFLRHQSTTVLLDAVDSMQERSSSSSDDDAISPQQFVLFVKGLEKKYAQIEQIAQSKRELIVAKIVNKIPESLVKRAQAFKEGTQKVGNASASRNSDLRKTYQKLSADATELEEFLYDIKTMILYNPEYFVNILPFLADDQNLKVPLKSNWGKKFPSTEFIGEIEADIEKFILGLPSKLKKTYQQHRNTLLKLELVRRFAVDWTIISSQKVLELATHESDSRDLVDSPVNSGSDSDPYDGLDDNTGNLNTEGYGVIIPVDEDVNYDPNNPLQQAGIAAAIARGDFNRPEGQYPTFVVKGADVIALTAAAVKEDADGYALIPAVLSQRPQLLPLPRTQSSTLLGLQGQQVRPSSLGYGVPVILQPTDSSRSGSANSDSGEASDSNSRVDTVIVHNTYSASDNEESHESSDDSLSASSIPDNIKAALKKLKRKNESKTNIEEISSFLKVIFELRARIIEHNEKNGCYDITKDDITQYFDEYYNYNDKLKAKKIGILMMHSVLDDISSVPDSNLSRKNMRQMLNVFVSAFKAHPDCNDEDNNPLAIDIISIDYDHKAFDEVLQAETAKYTQALIKAAPYGHEPTIRRLMNQGAHIRRTLPDEAEDVSQKIYVEVKTPLQIAAHHGKKAAVKAMLEVKDTQVSNPNEKLSSAHIGSALCSAAACGHEKTVKAILKHCSTKGSRAANQVSKKDFHQALKQAAIYNQPEVIKVLFTYDFSSILGAAKCKLTDNTNNDALDRALANGSEECEKLLLRNLAERIYLANGKTAGIINDDFRAEVAKKLKAELRHVFFEKIKAIKTDNSSTENIAQGTIIRKIKEVLDLYDKCKDNNHFINHQRHPLVNRRFFRNPNRNHSRSLVLLHLQDKVLKILDPDKQRRKSGAVVNFSSCEAIFQNLPDDDKGTLDELFRENLSGISHNGYMKPYVAISGRTIETFRPRT